MDQLINLYKYKKFIGEHLEPIIKSHRIYYPRRAKLNDQEDLKINIINDVNEETFLRFLKRKMIHESSCVQRKIGESSPKLLDCSDTFGIISLSDKAVEDYWSNLIYNRNLERSYKSNGDFTKFAQRKINESCTKSQNYLNTLGILSLSALENSLKLWERYADESKGVCLTFKISKSAPFLLEVQYKTPRPPLSLSDLMLSVEDEAQKKIIHHVLATKTTEWSYEREWRYFVERGNEEFSYLGTLEAITLGKNIHSENKQKIDKWVSEAGNQIFIREQYETSLA